MYDRNFFKLATLISQKHLNRDKFNLFSVLRNNSDEVRLHSRFLGELLNPRGSHELGEKLLQSLLSQLKLQLKPNKDCRVQLEHKNIDLLITHGSSAVIIENKIFAGDQPQQLKRYYDIVVSEGFSDIKILYLTPEGHPPSNDSKKGLDDDLIRCISYESEISTWVKQCITLAAENPPLRESLIQYIHVIENITGCTMSDNHVSDLKELIHPSSNRENFTNFKYLEQAHKEVTAELIADIWIKSTNLIGDQFKRRAEDSLETEGQIKAAISHHITRGQSSDYAGVHYAYNDEISIGFGMETQWFLVGIRHSKNKNEELHAKLLDITAQLEGKSTEWWPIYNWAQPWMNCRRLTTENLEFLSHESNRAEAAEKIAHRVLALKSLLDESL